MFVAVQGLDQLEAAAAESEVVRPSLGHAELDLRLGVALDGEFRGRGLLVDLWKVRAKGSLEFGRLEAGILPKLKRQ